MKLEEPGKYTAIEADDLYSWYAMSAPYRREKIAFDLFCGEGFECFLPLRQAAVRLKNGKSELKEIPAVPNLIFVRGRRKDIQSVKVRIGIAQYLTRKEGKKNIPITIPERQMADFRRALEVTGSRTLYLNPKEIDIRKGTRVRIVGGLLDGLEGVFMKVKGARSRRLVVMLEGIAALAAEVEPDYVQLITEKQEECHTGLKTT